MVNNIQSENFSFIASPRGGVGFKADSNTTFNLALSGRAQNLYNSLYPEAAALDVFRRCRIFRQYHPARGLGAFHGLERHRSQWPGGGL